MTATTGAAAAASISASTAAATIHVPAGQPTIKAAIAVASSGDEIVVADGTFTGPNNRGLDLLGKSLVVRSANGPDACVIDCEQLDRAFVLASAEPITTTIQGFTLRNGTALTAGMKGGAVLIDGTAIATAVTVRDCVVEDGSALGGGGGIALLGAASALIVDCEFTGCTAFLGGPGGGSGGAIAACGPGGALEVAGCAFVDNNAANGGAIQITQLAGSIVRDCVFVANVAATFGGAITWSQGSEAKLWNCRFHGNAGQAGGAVVPSDVTGMSIAGCEFSGNISASQTGGAVLVSGAEASILNCTFAGNTSLLPGGAGAIAKVSNLPCAIRNCVIWGNSAPQLSQFGANPLVVSHCIVQGGFAGDANLDVDPLLVEVAGADGLVGTIDDDLAVQSGSAAIDSGSNPAWNIALATDVDGNPRFVDDPGVVDAGEGTAPIIDRGATERPSAPGCALGDLNCDGSVNGGDLGLLLGAWGAADPVADLSGDGVVDGSDLGLLLGAWTG